MAAIQNGDEFKTKQGYTVKVVDYKGAKEIIVEFNDSTYTRLTVEGVQLKRGNLTNPYHPVVQGLGFMGIGPYVSKGEDKKFTREYGLWSGLMTRCYVEDGRYRNYKDCNVDPQWYNFQEFAEWCQWQSGYKQDGWQLDKDIASNGSKCYSPDTCIFVPRDINNLFRGSYNNDKKLPTGVFTSGKGFIVVGRFGAKTNQRFSGYATKELAYEKYSEERKKRAEGLLNTYGDMLDPRVIAKLRNFEVPNIGGVYE